MPSAFRNALWLCVHLYCTLVQYLDWAHVMSVCTAMGMYCSILTVTTQRSYFRQLIF